MRFFHIPYLLDRYREKKIWKREDKFMRDFTSYKVAFDELLEETEIVCVHLNKTKCWNQKLKLIDRLNIEHLVDVDSLDFVIQKRAELVYERIARLMQEGKKAEAKNAVSEVVNLIVRRCQKGFRDRDPSIQSNCGFVGEKAIKIDVGRFVRQEEMKKSGAIEKDLLQITHPFKTWLSEIDPELSSHLENELKVFKLKNREKQDMQDRANRAAGFTG
jgi:hypothetical protein